MYDTELPIGFDRWLTTPPDDGDATDLSPDQIDDAMHDLSDQWAEDHAAELASILLDDPKNDAAAVAALRAKFREFCEGSADR